MHIIRDRSKKQLWLSQERYVTKVLQRFNMSEAKPVGSTLPENCKLSGKLSPKTKAEKAEMMKIPYASGVHPTGYRICSQSGEPVHEQSRQGALERGQVDTPVLEGHFKHVPPIRLRGSCFVAVEAVEDGCIVNHGGGVHGDCGSRQGSTMDEELHR